MKLDNYVKSEEFGCTGNAIAFPDGETLLNPSIIEVEEMEVVFDGKAKKRYILHVGDQSFWCGVKVMQGVQKCIKEGATLVKVIKQGVGKNTSYIVLPGDDKK